VSWVGNERGQDEVASSVPAYEEWRWRVIHQLVVVEVEEAQISYSPTWPSLSAFFGFLHRSLWTSTAYLRYYTKFVSLVLSYSPSLAVP
jgi:hypothetical protein